MTPTEGPQMYRVRWEIDIWADSREDAVEKSLAIHRNPESIATVFDVAPHEQFLEHGESIFERIDLSEERT